MSKPFNDDAKAYDVGNKRPPTHTRFKPGQSGNPRGRPRRSKQIDDLIRRELDQTIVIKEGGREIRVSKRAAMIKQLVNQAIKGDPKARQFVLSHLEKHREIEPFVSTAADDAELLRLVAGSALSGAHEGEAQAEASLEEVLIGGHVSQGAGCACSAPDQSGGRRQGVEDADEQS